MRIRNIGSNQTEITRNDGTTVLVSYETPVAAYRPGEGYIRTEENYSKTTSKHINQWTNGANAHIVPQSEIDRLTE
jgi:hypothetical protein